MPVLGSGLQDPTIDRDDIATAHHNQRLAPDGLWHADLPHSGEKQQEEDYSDDKKGGAETTADADVFSLKEAQAIVLENVSMTLIVWIVALCW